MSSITKCAPEPLSVIDILELFVVSEHEVPLQSVGKIRTTPLKPSQNPSKCSLMGPESCSVSVSQDCPKALRPALAPDSGKGATPNNLHELHIEQHGATTPNVKNRTLTVR
jgi:hypothetical protein